MAEERGHGFTWTVADSSLVSGGDTWGDALVAIGRRDPRVVCLSADLSRTTQIGRFREAFPDRFVNVGVAEQNLIAVAAGLAATGLVPVVSTYAAFASLRAAEFVRTDVCYNARPVKIVATLSGVAFGQGGPTHHALEDLALMRALPGMTVLAPCDGAETAALVAAAIAHPGPVYLRLGRGMEPPVHPRPPTVTIGRSIELRPGDRVTVIACGVCVWHALAAAERAARDGISVRVIDMHTIKPLDEAAVLRALGDTRRIVTVEDHAAVGGLGSAVAEVIGGSGRGAAFERLGHGDVFAGMGLPDDLWHRAGIDEHGILAAIARVARRELSDDADWEEPPP